MENRFEMFLEILGKFHDCGLLDELVLIGSWCMPFYKKLLSGSGYSPTIRTRDVDFAIPQPAKIKSRADVGAILKDEGFVTDFRQEDGFVRYLHPELIVEFLVPEKGRGTDRPVEIPSIGVNAQALRYLNFLLENTVIAEYEGVRMRVPHPAAYGLHKIIISSRRKEDEKADKDRREALEILNAVMLCGESFVIKKLFSEMPAPWQKKIQKTLEPLDAGDLVSFLS